MEVLPGLFVSMYPITRQRKAHARERVSALACEEKLSFSSYQLSFFSWTEIGQIGLCCRRILIEI